MCQYNPLKNSSMQAANTDQPSNPTLQSQPQPPQPSAVSPQQWRQESQPPAASSQNSQDQAIADNQSNCFKCKKRGQIFCCDNCQRSYHSTCLPNTPTEDIWKCPCCLLREQCPLCETPIQTSQRYVVCNLCYRKTHNSCTHLPKEVLEARYEVDQGQLGQAALLESMFVCFPCLYGSEVRLTARTLRNVNYENYRLVNPCFCSGAHLGWVSETNLRKISEKPKKVVKPSKFANQGFYHPPTPDRIIGMKTPLLHSNKSLPQLLFILRDPRRRPDFGSPDNFKFLVKWKQQDYASSTWQDETVLRNSRSPALQNYLIKKEYEFYCVVERRAPSKDFRQMPKNVPVLKERESIFVNELVAMYQGKRNVFMMKFSTKERSYHQLLSALICRLFYQTLTLQPFLVIARYRDIQTWSKAINEFCPGLYLVILTGQQQSRDVIKSRDLFYASSPQVPKFDVLLTSCDCFSKDLSKFYNSRMSMSWSSIIYDDQLKSNYLIERDVKARETHKIWLTKQFDQVEFKLAAKILNPDKRLANQIKKAELYKQQLFACLPKSYLQFEQFQVDMTLHRKTLLVHFPKLYNALARRPETQLPENESCKLQAQLPQSEQQKRSSRQIKTATVAEEIQSHLHTSRYLKAIYQNNVNKQLPLQKYKRIAFLRFVIAFGLQFPTPSTLLQKLTQFDRSVFTSTPQQLTHLQSYTMTFLATLNSTSPHQNSSKLLFNLKPSAVLRRIIDIHNIQLAYEKYKDDVKGFPVKCRFDIPVELHRNIQPEEAWKTVDDILLLKLIVQYGYDNWIEICTAQDWVPQVYQFRLNNPLDFLLRKMCNLPTAGPLDQLRSCCRLISSRASLLAEMLRHQPF